MLRVEEVIAKSSNIGAAKIGILMGEQRLHYYMRAFGMGEPTRVPLGGEVRGMVNPVKNWSKISVAWIPMGHEVAVTPVADGDGDERDRQWRTVDAADAGQGPGG